MGFILANYVEILSAAAAAFVVGALWYGPIFGKPWMSLMGFTPESMKAMKMSPVVAMILGFFCLVLMATGMEHAYVYTSVVMGAWGMIGGWMVAFAMWLTFVFPVTAGVVLWEGKSVKLLILNAAYYLVVLLVMGTIIGGF